MIFAARVVAADAAHGEGINRQHVALVKDLLVCPVDPFLDIVETKPRN